MDNQDTAQVATQDGVGGDAAVDNTATPAQPPQINLQDLQNLRAIVDTAVRRGAFQAAEASFVGAAFDRLNTFLNSVAPAPTEGDQSNTVSAPAAQQ
jgi:hypothetical protein